MQALSKWFFVCTTVLLVGCDPGSPEGTAEFSAGGKAAALTQAEFNQLPPEQQYQVAHKLTATLFKGIPAEDFFDLSSGTDKLTPRNPNFLNEVRAALKTKMNPFDRQAIDIEIDGIDSEGNPDPDQAKYLFDTRDDAERNQRPRQIPLARIKEYPLSRDQFVQWMAYFLANTIMFSPAEEMESTDMNDVQNMYRFLVDNLDKNNTVRQIIRSNLPSLARWRVSRSAENHALEAFELYLGLFETEEDSYRGGIACKDLYLTDEDNGYLIRRTDFPNTEPQLILGSSYVTTCDDLYDVIAGHSLLMPRVTEVIINYLMSGAPLQTRLDMIAAINASNPQTFSDIFTAIIFSREYLLNTERPKSFEENIFALMDNLKWDPRFNNAGAMDRRIFTRMTSNNVNVRINLPAKGWANMRYKIGRLPDVPLDGVSFASYHKGLREEFLIRPTTYQGGSNNIAGLFYDENNETRSFLSEMSPTEFLDFLFLSVLQRKPTATEVTDLMAIIRDENGDGSTSDSHLQDDLNGVEVIRDKRHDNIARIVFDYISRLPEFYYFKAID